jgi:hypothetical protein
MTHAARCLAVAGAVLCGIFAPAAMAQNAPDAGQTPPPPAEAAPAPEPGATPQGNCITENDDYKMSGTTPIFVIALENKCEQRLTCKVYVNVSSAKGSAQGHATMVLGPKSSGAAAKKSYTIKVKMMGGVSQSSRECKAS